MTTTENSAYVSDAERFTGIIIEQITAADRLYDLLVATLDSPVSESDDYIEITRLTNILELVVDDNETCEEIAQRLTVLTSEWGYGTDTRTVVRVTLAGGGPEGWIDFTLDERKALIGAEVGYRDWWQTAITTPLTDDQAAAAYSLYRVEWLVGD